MYQIAAGRASDKKIREWIAKERLSLYSSFNQADAMAILPWKQKLRNQILVKKFMEKLESGAYYPEAFRVFGDSGINEKQFHILMDSASKLQLRQKSEFTMPCLER